MLFYCKVSQNMNNNNNNNNNNNKSLFILFGVEHRQNYNFKAMVTIIDINNRHNNNNNNVY